MPDALKTFLADAVGRAIALVMLVAALPFILIVALLSKTIGGVHPINSQLRVGKNERTFVFYKLRTVTRSRDLGALQQHVLRAVISLLRLTSADDLPQLWNVIIGDMALVGPRPHTPTLDSRYIEQLPDLVKRYQVKPGITGLAQVNGMRGMVKSVADMEARLSFDLTYIRERSWLLDMQILLRTVFGGFVDFDQRSRTRHDDECS